MKALHPSNISDQLFNIPIYQRLFTWGEEQIKELLDDLLYEYLSNEVPSDYHIGVLTVKHNASSKRLDLVDGQQRFTVMMLMGCVMKEHYIEWKKSFLKYNNDIRLDFRARPDDRKYMTYLIDGGDLVDSINETMNNGINFISEYLKEENFSSHYKKLSSGFDSKKRQICVEGFCQYVYEHLSFFLSYLPDDYNARLLNKHFESMNSTGRNLENHEILKVQLLKMIPPEEYGACVEMWNQASRMEQTICPLSNPDEKQTHIDTIIKARATDIFSINKQEDARKPENVSIKALLDGNGGANMQTEEGSNNNNVSAFRSFLNFTDYLLQVLYLMLDVNEKANVVHQQFFNPNNLIKTCERYIGTDEVRIKPIDFIKAIYRYRFFFDYYILRIDGKGLYRLLSSESSEHDKLEQYEAMLYADSSRYTYYRWIPFILEYVSNESNSIDNEQLLSKLKVHDSLIDEHSETNFKNFSFGKFNNYYFRRLDYLLWEYVIDDLKDDNLEILPEGILIDDTLIKAIKEYKFHQYNSVEHFHPRSEREQKEHWGDDVKDSFGNLALISDLFNLTQSDNALALKFARVKDQISKEAKLESIKLALMYYSANQNEENWTIETMKKHEELMVTILEKSYRRTDESVNS